MTIKIFYRNIPSYILNNGEIPKLFSNMNYYNSVIDSMKEAVKGELKYKDFGDPELFELIKDRCWNNIHVMLAFSPIGEDFKRRLSIFH